MAFGPGSTPPEVPAIASITRGSISLKDKPAPQPKKRDVKTPWVRDARKEYAQIQRNMMSGLMMRKSRNKALGTPEEPSLISQLASVITGQKILELDRRNGPPSEVPAETIWLGG